VCLLAGLSPALPAQAPGRVATTPAALIASPIFFHGKQVAVRGATVPVGEQGRLQIPVDEADLKRGNVPHVFVFWKDRPSDDAGEIRGEFWDLGRVNSDDGRFTTYDFTDILETATKGRWPGRDEVFVILGAVMIGAPLPPAPTLRAIALSPDDYGDREITVTGRFRGRNLYGDLPNPINRSKWDFVLQSADAAVWVSGVRPRGKGFDLDPGARVDTGRWLQVTGTVRTQGSAVWIEAARMELSTPPSETPIEVAVPPPPRPPPPTVVFSAPVSDEANVERETTVRIQFSWDMDGETFRDRVRVTYVPPPQGVPPAPPAFTAAYSEGNRALQIRFAGALERFQQVKVELLEGIQSVDGQPLQPWTLIFTTGA
jgi:hypothetical protein